MILFYTFLVLVTLQCGEANVSCCSVCDCRSHEVWCEYRGLKEVPADIPISTTRLYLFNNNISMIPAGIFANLKVSLFFVACPHVCESKYYEHCK